MQELKVFFRQCLKEFFHHCNIKPQITVLRELERDSFWTKDEELINGLTNKFFLYLKELKKWNKAYSLTSIEDEREIIVKHFIDSLLYLTFIPDKNLNVADVGSGAGFPGVPLAIVKPELNITLIEPSWKKAAFLKNIKRKLNLKNIEILQANAEDVHEKFDIVFSRALWSIKNFVKNCKHLLRENGYFVISKSLKVEEELKNLPDGFKIEIKEFTLPFYRAKRYIIKISR